MIKIAKATFKKYGWGMLGALIGAGLVDLYQGKEFSLSNWGLRIVVFVVMYLLLGTIEYKSGKLQ